MVSNGLEKKLQAQVWATNINVTEMFVQLFDKLKLQDSSEGDKSAKKHKTPRSTQTSGSSHPASGSGSSKPESKPSDADETKQDQRASQEAQAPEAAQKKGSQRYGMVRTRHVNQLFIRGENVILVNPQPLWFWFSV